ncbi:hypothetical protein QR680_014852 [Steinernema hermaphroditum]|uniref:Cullin family profile domain-containing protein n=1 Tax=Steinernema hermaphroditum TaxID=289476 RepID=A0AA39ICI1_9BILA|nr:hypothetical protein QR680_014852 [Steinernema hermaphroditum]
MAATTTKKTPKLTFELAYSSIMPTLAKAILAEKVSIAEYMKLYTAVADFCKVDANSSTSSLIGGGRGDIMYKAVTQFLREAISQRAAEIAAIRSDEERLIEHKAAWEKYKNFSQFTNGAFRYLNQHWTKRVNDVSMVKPKEGEEPQRPQGKFFEVYTLCMVIWKEEMFEKTDMAMTKSALGLMKADRDGENGVQVDLIKALVEALVEAGIEYKKIEDPVALMGDEEEKTVDENELTEEARTMLQTYEKYFETLMLEETFEYYKKESANVMGEGNIISYMEKAQQRLDEESHRSKFYLHNILTHDRLQNAVERAYIVARLDMFQNEFKSLLSAEKNYELELMYGLCSRVQEAIDQLKEDFAGYVNEKGREAIATIPEAMQNDPNVFMEVILKTLTKYQEMARDAFRADHGFKLAYDAGCTRWINKNCITEKVKALNKSAELLARFVDVAMRKGAAEDYEKTHDKAMAVFHYIDDKDIFQKYYNRFLSKRLLMDTSMNEDAEAGMIARLKSACGHEYTTSATRMFSDISTSKDLTRKFRDQFTELKVDANISVLNTAVWGYSPAYTFDLPAELNAVVGSFEEHYKIAHSGRKLNWLHHMSRGEITASGFGKRKYTFIATAPQMVVLLKFNDTDALTMSHIHAETSLPHDILKGVLASFVKAEILKLPEGTKFTSSLPQSTEFTLNKKFVSKRIKMDLMKLQTVIKGDGDAKKEQAEMEKTLDEDRKMVIQAAIVRTMKMRKKLVHNMLITEVVEQVAARFQPKITMVKKCIDLLMEKEYLKRAEDDKDSYEYIS